MNKLAFLEGYMSKQAGPVTDYSNELNSPKIQKQIGTQADKKIAGIGKPNAPYYTDPKTGKVPAGGVALSYLGGTPAKPMSHADVVNMHAKDSKDEFKDGGLMDRRQAAFNTKRREDDKWMETLGGAKQRPAPAPKRTPEEEAEFKKGMANMMAPQRSYVNASDKLYEKGKLTPAKSSNLKAIRKQMWDLKDSRESGWADTIANIGK